MHNHNRPYNKNRRAYDNGNNSFQDRRNGTERRARPQKPNYNNGISPETAAEIKNLLASISESQNAIAVAAERRADAEERKAGALEFLANNISSFMEDLKTEKLAGLSDGIQPAAAAAPPTVKAGKAYVTNIISQMRKDGATYEEIAKHLTDLDLPTFSGRGKWHAQTIHRLCNAAEK